MPYQVNLSIRCFLNSMRFDVESKTGRGEHHQYGQPFHFTDRNDWLAWPQKKIIHAENSHCFQSDEIPIAFNNVFPNAFVCLQSTARHGWVRRLPAIQHMMTRPFGWTVQLLNAFECLSMYKYLPEHLICHRWFDTSTPWNMIARIRIRPNNMYVQ